MAVAGRMPAYGGPVASMGSSKATPRRPQSHGFFSFFPWPTTLWRCLLLGMLLKLGVVNTYATLGVLGVAFDACCSALIASAKENKRFARLLPPVACLGVRMLSHAVHMLCLCCAFVMRLCCAFVMRHAISVPRSEPRARPRRRRMPVATPSSVSCTWSRRMPVATPVPLTDACGNVGGDTYTYTYTPPAVFALAAGRTTRT